MKKFLTVSIITALWIFSMFQLYIKNVRSDNRVNFMYKEFIPPDLVLRDEWFGIYFNNNKIGYANFTFGLDEVDAHQGYKMDAEAFLLFPVLGTTQRVWLKMSSKIDPKYRLKSFSLSFFSSVQQIEISGIRKNENRFTVTIRQNGQASETEITIPEGTVLDNFFGPPKELHNPHPGMRIKFLSFNPLTLQFQEVQLSVLSQEEIKIDSQKLSSYLVVTKFSGLESKAWIDDKGRLLKEETPLGITLIREPQDKALEFISATKKENIDLAQFFSIPSNVRLEPEKINKLYVKLSVSDIDTASLNNNRQQVLKIENASGIKKIYIVITKTPTSTEKGSISEYLKSDNFIQADDPQIKSIANYLTKNLNNEREKVKALLKWVYNYLEKKPTLSIPSALTALNSHQGDCNEHTFLFAALARSINIPTKIKNGLVYINNRFYYHSWPAVYINGQWIDVDPTLNQFPADVTHISLVEGELSQQMDIIKLVGKIKLEVIKYE